ncbi:MAG: hypothetical protein KF861_07145 [Planctomycetaceae bacterium]|nr:hypothetical protein [Planctomycetaceae bacterium]
MNSRCLNFLRRVLAPTPLLGCALLTVPYAVSDDGTSAVGFSVVSDRCDDIMTEEFVPCEPSQPAPTYLVPPLYVPCPPSQPVRQSEPTPAKVEPTATPLPQKSPAAPAPTMSSPVNLSDVFSDERTERLNKLGSLLDRLNERLHETAPTLPPDKASSLPPVIAESNRESDPPPARPPRNIPRAANVPPTNANAAESSADSLPLPPPPEMLESVPATAIADAPAATNPSPGPSPQAVLEQTPSARSWIAQTAVDAPVDRLALADNLYAAGETATALNLYLEIDMKALGLTDRHWVQLQLAGCYRRLGNIEEASKHYRTLVAIEEPVWMAETARWWLMVLDKRKAMLRQTQDLDSLIRQLKEQVDAELRR